MNNMYKGLVSLISAGVIAFSLGCEKYETGTVIKENLIRPSIVRINNTEIKVGEKEYLLQVKNSEEEIYTFSVREGSSKTIEALAEVITEGKKIEFAVQGTLGGRYFGTDKIGVISASEINVLE